MEAPLLVLLREGLEASLVVVIIAMYLRKLDRKDLLKPMWMGVGAAVGLCIVLGLGMHAAGRELPTETKELIEAVIGFIAVGILTWMIFWMRRFGSAIKGDMEHKIDSALTSSSSAGRTLIGLAFVSVLREGVEAVLLTTRYFDQKGSSALIGSFIGLAIAVIMGVALYRGALHLNMKTFFNITGVVIIFFAAGVFAWATKELSFSGNFPWLGGIAWDTSGILEQSSRLGTAMAGLFGYSQAPAWREVVAYWVYLVPVLILFVFGKGGMFRAKVRSN